MKKRIILPLLFVLLSIAVIVACKKSKDDKPVDCKFCRVHGPDLNIIDSAEVCTDDEETALHNKYPGRQITCQ